MPRGLRSQLRLLIALLIVVAAAYITGVPLPRSGPASTPGNATTTIDSTQYYPVTHVVDGDTIDIDKDGVRVAVRLIGINTPEVAGPYTKAQCYGAEASAEAKKIMNGSSVRLETDPSQDLYDKYHRLLAYVYVPANVRPEGIMVNEYMVAGGFAREYTYKKPYAHQAAFKADEAAARAAGKGLWGACSQ